MCLRRIRGAAEAAHAAQPFAHQITTTERQRFLFNRKEKQVSGCPTDYPEFNCFWSSMMKCGDGFIKQTCASPPRMHADWFLMLVLCRCIPEAKTRYNAKISPKKRFPKINGFDSGGRGGGLTVFRRLRRIIAENHHCIAEKLYPKPYDLPPSVPRWQEFRGSPNRF